MAKTQRIEVEHLLNDGSKDWSHAKGLGLAGVVAGGLVVLLSLLHSCYPVPPRAPAAARGSK